MNCVLGRCIPQTPSNPGIKKDSVIEVAAPKTVEMLYDPINKESVLAIPVMKSLSAYRNDT